MKTKALFDLYNTLVSVSRGTYPRKMSLAIVRNAMNLEPEIKAIEKERLNILEKYAEKDERGNVKFDEASGQTTAHFPSSAALREYKREMDELNDIEIEVSVAKFSRDLIDECYEKEEYSILTPAQEVLLDPIIED